MNQELKASTDGNFTKQVCVPVHACVCLKGKGAGLYLQETMIFIVLYIKLSSPFLLKNPIVDKISPEA